CSGRRHPAMLTIGNRIYLGLGDDAVDNLKDWWMYDITSDSWSQIADLPGPPRHHPYMFNADGDVFVGLGHRGNTIYRDWYKLDTVSNVWNSMSIFPGEGRVAGTQLGNGKYGYVISGDGDNHSYMETGEMWRYDPSDDSWTELPPHPGISRWAPGSFVIENNVYFFGGLNRQTGTFPNDLWKFELEDEMVDTNSTSILQNLSLANTFIYPNPTNNILMWENDQKITSIKIFNALGKLVISEPAIAKQVEVKNLNDGLYLVQFYTENQAVKTSKLLVNH
ncbi:MAG: T9SS type A sorting domain-containing protein, partial [Chitinophagales bacterium]|nr:T9SS type A sorting domain-containing protein [Chitinophagales bacterium]